MRIHKLGLGLAILGALGSQHISAQNGQPAAPRPTPTPIVVAPPTIIPSPQTLSQNVPREKREQAYTKLLEGQRYLWGMSRVRSQAGAQTALRLAKQALQKAVELDPTLSEGYTALAEISLSTPPGNIDEAIILANISSKLNADNYGAHRILARVYTIKSRLGSEALEPVSAQKAITEWKEVTRLDPRNAEAWAFLSEFYAKTNRNQERVEALRNWGSAAAALDNRFYRTILGAQENLSPENAAVKLGEALIQTGQPGEAVEILSRTIADSPENLEAIDLLRQAIQSGDGKSSNATLESLQQAVFANPANTVLVGLLADMQAKSGKTDDAVKTIKSSLAAGNADKASVANLQVTLGDIYVQANRSNEAIFAYEDSLKTYGINNTALTTEEEREFATKVFEKMINAYKTAGRVNEARATIERARIVLGNAELFSDKQIVNLLRETGKKNEALQAVRNLRKESSGDYSLMRLEASILTDLGKVDEGAALIKTLISTKPELMPSPYYDDFTNYVFISGLYTQAKRPQEAIANAQKARTVAQTEERKQIADMILATARHQSGDYKSAETILRGILKKTPGNPIALNNLGYFLLERDERLNEAHNLIQQAVRIDPTNSSYLDSLGWANFKLGKLDESEKYLKQALLYNPSSSNTYEHLGDVYEKQGKMELAKSSWQKALSMTADENSLSRIKVKMTK